MAEFVCLMSDVDSRPHGAPSEEHYLPRCLGGGPGSWGLLCEPCNHRFGRTTEEDLNGIFRHLLDELGPHLPSHIRDREWRTADDLTGMPIVRTGGYFNAPSVGVVHDVDHDRLVVTAPATMGEDAMRQVAIGRANQVRRAAGKPPLPASTPLVVAPVDPSARPRTGFTPPQFTEATVAGVTKLALQMVDVAFNHAPAGPARSIGFRFLRDWLNRLEFSRYCWCLAVPCDDALNIVCPPDADGWPLTRAVATYSAETHVFRGILQVAGACPLVVRFDAAMSRPPPSFTVVVRKSLRAGQPQTATRMDTGLDDAAFKWAETRATKATWNDNRRLFFERYLAAAARARFLGRLHADSVATVLDNHMAASWQDLTPGRRAVEAILLWLFQTFEGNVAPPGFWEAIRTRTVDDVAPLGDVQGRFLAPVAMAMLRHVQSVLGDPVVAARQRRTSTA